MEKEVSGEVGVWLHDRAGPSGISRSAVALSLCLRAGRVWTSVAQRGESRARSIATVVSI
jgi:hypothetical protein